MKFAQTLRQLPPVSHLLAIELLDDSGQVVDTVENREGKAGALAVYAALAKKHGGLLNREAATEGLVLFAEHTEDARAHPGKHLNIDRLFAILETGQSLRMRLLPPQLD